MSLDLGEEFFKKSHFQRLLLRIFIWVVHESFEHSGALVLVESAHLAHFVNFLQELHRSVLKSHHAGDDHAYILSDIVIKLLDDLLLYCHQLANVRSCQIDGTGAALCQDRKRGAERRSIKIFHSFEQRSGKTMEGVLSADSESSAHFIALFDAQSAKTGN